MNFPYKSTATKTLSRGAPSPTLYDIHDVMVALRLGRTKVDELSKQGKLGEVIFLGKRSKRWKASAVLAFANGQ